MRKKPRAAADSWRAFSFTYGAFSCIAPLLLRLQVQPGASITAGCKYSPDLLLLRAPSTARTRILARFRCVSTLAPAPALAFADALDEADGRAGKVELLAQAVFKKTLVAEVQLIA